MELLSGLAGRKRFRYNSTFLRENAGLKGWSEIDSKTNSEMGRASSTNQDGKDAEGSTPFLAPIHPGVYRYLS
jgi:hypothetical protein